MTFTGVLKRTGRCLWAGVVREGFLDWELLTGRDYAFHLCIPILGFLPGIQQVLNKCILDEWMKERAFQARDRLSLDAHAGICCA